MANKFFTSIKARFFSSPSSTAIDVGVNDETHPRFTVDAGGRLTWGGGDEAGDVYVYRTGVEAINFVGDVGVNTAAPAYELDVTGTVSTNKVNFDLGTNDLLEDGDLAWDDLDQALAYRTNGLTVDIGQENVVYVRNPAGGSTITKGSVVAVLGSDSNRLSVQLCDATAGTGLGCRTVGVAMQNIASPGFGFVSTFGLLRGFNTGNIIGSAPVNPGTELFISSTPGVLSTDPQPSPGRRVTVGYVVTTGTQGSIFVTIRRGLAVNELDNVTAPSPADGDVLVYDGDNSVWTSASATFGGGGAGVSVTTTPPAGPSEGDLWFNSVSGKTFVYVDNNWLDTSGPLVDFVAQRVAARGDILVATSATDVERFAVGPDNYVLAADSSASHGVSWLDVSEVAPPGPEGPPGPIQTNLPQSTNATIVASDAGKHLNRSAGTTINSSTGFSVGDVVSIYNSGTGNITLTATGVTLRLAGTATTGNRTLAQKGLVTILCVATNDYVIAGAGLT